MRGAKFGILVITGLIAIGVGCRKNVIDKAAFQSTLNNYLSGRQECVWAAPVKLPAQADTSNDEQTKGFDALTDAGLLTRKPEEKKRFLIGSKQVNDYDLSDKGRSTWTADTSQPGYGNFCYGHPEVTSIDGYTPADNPDATQFDVNYHYAVTSLADWANTAEMRTAFPKIASDTNGQETATASLTKSDNGWTVANVRPAAAGAQGQ
jgi:hypothetical protein